MNRKALASWVALAACTSSTPKPSPVEIVIDDPAVDDSSAEDPGVDDPPVVDPPIDEPTLAVAADERSFIVALGGSGSACPDQRSRGWLAERALPSAITTDPYAEAGPTAPARLCRYRRGEGAERWPFDGISAPAVKPIPLTVDASGSPLPAGTIGVHDRLVVQPVALIDDLVDIHHARFAAAAGYPRLLAPFPPSDQPVRLALLDTVADTTTPWPASSALWSEPASHGLWLAALAQELVCLDQVHCPVELTTRQVMRLADTPFSPASDGRSWGTISDLAQAIDAEVGRWQLDQVAGAVGPLVINLSLAWHPRFGGGMPGAWEVAGEGQPVPVDGGGTLPFSWSELTPGSFPPDVQAALYAMARARCAGALVVAAVGNDTGGPVGRSGPLLPAAWEGLDASSLLDCAALDLGPVDPGPAAPLVVAAGGVDIDGGEPPLSRPASRPHLVAASTYATHHAPTALVGRTGEPLTGSSVAALVISATAALGWAALPSQTPAELLSALRAAAAPAGVVSPWLDDRPDRSSGLIRACDVIMQLQPGPWFCKLDQVPDFGFIDQSALTDELDGTWPVSDTPTACGDRLVFPAATDSTVVADDPCPDLQYFGPAVAPWIFPQPDTTGCPDCFVDLSQGRLHLRLSDLGSWRSPTLTLASATGPISYALPHDPADVARTTLTLRFRPLAPPVGVRAAWISAVRDDRSVSWAITLLP